MGMCGGLFWSILDQKELTNVPRPKEFTVTLTAGDRAKLTRVVSSGRHPARMITRARVLLALDETAGPAPDRRVVAERVGTSESTVYLVAKAFDTCRPGRGCDRTQGAG